MASRSGRKRKPGPRTKSDRPSRAGIGPDRGTDHTQSRQVIFGHDGCDAIGRAYRTGLLGEGSEAKSLLDTARRISSLYQRTYVVSPYNCPIAVRTSGGGPEHEQTLERQLWLRDTLRAIVKRGWHNPFYELAIEPHPDKGPIWLERMIAEQRTASTAKPPRPPRFNIRDTVRLARGLEALVICGA